MRNKFRSFGLWAGVMAAMAYLALSVAMAGGGAVVSQGQVVQLADLCGGDELDGMDCPFCTLAAAVDFPTLPDLPQVGSVQVMPWAVVRAFDDPVTQVLGVPPVRGPPRDVS